MLMIFLEKRLAMNEDRFDALVRKYMEYDKTTLAALLAQRENGDVKINEPYAPWSPLPPASPSWPDLKWTVTA